MIGLPVGPGILLAGSLASGLALSPFLSPPLPPLAMIVLSLPLLLLRRPVNTTGLALLILGFCLGLWTGQMRVNAIDGAGFKAEPGQEVTYHGHLTQAPRHGRTGDRLYLSGSQGRIMALTARAPVWAKVGAGAVLKGHVEEPPSWLRDDLRRRGIATAIRIDRLRQGESRSGLAGTLDRVRQRALAGLRAGMPAREAALAGGFVLGQDEAIDPQTKEDFQRSGLAHLLAVSGQNVMLLILLGSLPLVVAGVHLRHRIWPLALLVLIYLPLAGGGPSIQRATVMGIVMLLMLRLGQPSQRFFALLVAAALTLLVNPRSSGDIGWQLSFAATVAIMVMAPRLRRLLLAAGWLVRLGAFGRLLADGAAVTVAASLATAPLMAHHFGSLPLGTISANLLALPAVAPAMWLGMVAAIAGQLPGIPTEAINLLNSALIAYIAEVAALIASLEAGVVEVSLGPVWLVLACEIAVVVFGWWLTGWLLERKEGGAPDAGRSRTELTLIVLISLAVAIPATAALAPTWLFGDGQGPPRGLRIVALDVGQGDAILVQADETSLLIDTGPPNADIARSLTRYGVDHLEAVFITHTDRDHIGGLDEVIGSMPVERLYFGDGTTTLRGSNPISSIRQGERMRFGELALDVLWPPPAENTLAGEADRNRRSLVLLLQWRGFKALFTGDAEAETAPFPAPDIDLLKVAHHGSADAGLPALLQATTPALALISVGADNGYGHPAPSTLAALRSKSIPIHRTDREGDLVLEMAGGRD